MYRRIRARTIAGALIILSLVAVLHARQQPRFQGGVEVVLIDVNVVDRQGKPVGSLKAEDFTVNVDRKPRKIVSAEFIDYGTRGTSDRRASPGTGASVLDKLAKQPPAVETSRSVVLVFDEDNLDIATGMEARKAAEKFLGQLGSNDRIGVATLPNLRDSITLTRDRAEVRKAIAAVVTGGAPRDNPTRYAVGLSEAFALEQGDGDALERIRARECYNDPAWQSASASNRARPNGEMGTGDQMCLAEIDMVVRQTALQGRLRGQRTVDALRDLGLGLGQIDGPKTVVFISGGMPMPDVRSAVSLSRLGEAFAAAQISFYTIYVERERGQKGAASGPSPTPEEDASLELAGAENATGVAGGTLLNAGKLSLDPYFDRVATEISAAYILGIEVSPADRDNRPHFVQVKVNRPNVEVRARKQYMIAPAKPAAAAAKSSAPPAASAAAHAARMAARPAPIVPDVASVTPELQALLVRAGEFVLDYEPRVDRLLAEEAYDQVLSKWQAAPASAGAAAREDWAVERQRHMTSDYLLARGAGQVPWQHVRDPLQVDGADVGTPGRLAKLFVQPPSAALAQAAEIMTESARYNLGFGERNMDVPTLALVLLEPANRDRLFFRKEGEEPTRGVACWRVAFVETGTPPIFAGSRLQGTVWVEPVQGRIVRSALRLDMAAADAEVTVTYGPTPDLGGLWVPIEMRETYTSDTQKLETMARYSKFRILK